MSSSGPRLERQTFDGVLFSATVQHPPVARKTGALPDYRQTETHMVRCCGILQPDYLEYKTNTVGQSGPCLMDPYWRGYGRYPQHSGPFRNSDWIAWCCFSGRKLLLIQNIPCVVEVNETPHFTGRYAGELSDISTYYRQDADDSDRTHAKDAFMLTVGHSVADAGYVVLLPAAVRRRRAARNVYDERRDGWLRRPDGLASRRRSRMQQGMQLVYGPWYNRASGTIGDYQVASAQCESGQTCTVSFPAARGTLVYYLWVDRDSSGCRPAVR